MQVTRVSAALMPTDTLEVVPTERFYDQMHRTSYMHDLLSVVDSIDSCCIAGGFLLRCTGLSLADNSVPDVDIFVWDNMHNALIESIQKTLVCRCFTRANVTVVLVHGCEEPIQVISTQNSGVYGVLACFDFPCCELAYHKGKYYISDGFKKMRETPSGVSFTYTGTTYSCRLEKYQRRGFDIEHSKCILTNHGTLEEIDKKHYKWTDESPDELLEIVRSLFHEDYEHTRLPLPPVKDDVYNIVLSFGSKDDRSES